LCGSEQDAPAARLRQATPEPLITNGPGADFPNNQRWQVIVMNKMFIILVSPCLKHNA
jgi:hypothetical protein